MGEDRAENSPGAGPKRQQSRGAVRSWLLDMRLSQRGPPSSPRGRGRHSPPGWKPGAGTARGPPARTARPASRRGAEFYAAAGWWAIEIAAETALRHGRARCSENGEITRCARATCTSKKAERGHLAA